MHKLDLGERVLQHVNIIAGRNGFRGLARGTHKASGNYAFYFTHYAMLQCSKLLPVMLIQNPIIPQRIV